MSCTRCTLAIHLSTHLLIASIAIQIDMSVWCASIAMKLHSSNSDLLLVLLVLLVVPPLSQISEQQRMQMLQHVKRYNQVFGDATPGSSGSTRFSFSEQAVDEALDEAAVAAAELARKAIQRNLPVAAAAAATSTPDTSGLPLGLKPLKVQGTLAWLSSTCTRTAHVLQMYC